MGVKLKLLVCISIVSILFSTTAYALGTTEFDLHVNNKDHSHSIDPLEYGNIIDIPLKIINTQTCNIVCDIYVNKKKEYPLGEIGNEAERDYSIVAPLKGQDDESKDYVIEAKCKETGTLFCTGVERVEDIMVTVPFRLTEEQREARDYVEARKDLLRDSLINSDKNIKIVEDKLSQLQSNIKTGTIPSEISNLREAYSSYKNLYENIRKLYESYDYIDAKNLFATDLTANVDNIVSRSSDLDINLKQIIEMHNRIATKVEELAESNTYIKNKLRVFNEENNIISEIDSVITKFNGGTFSSYSDIEPEIDSLISRANSLKKNLVLRLAELEKEVLIIFQDEAERLCQKENICANRSETRNVEDSCSGLKSLSSNVYAENNKRQNDYSNAKKEIDNFNEEINGINNKFEVLNDQLKQTKIDVEQCIKLISNTNKNVKEGQIINIKDDLSKIKEVCYSLEKDLENAEKKNFFGKILSFFSRLFGGSGGQLDKLKTISKTKEPEIISISDTTRAFIENKCDFDLKQIENKYKVSVADVIEKDIQGELIDEAKLGDKVCCVLDKCETCCIEDSCRTNPKTYPIIFLHGHSVGGLFDSLDYSIDTFSQFQEKLSSENYIKAGIILPETNINSVNQGDWGRVPIPISVRASYYKGVYDESDGRTVGKEEGKSISVYAKRLANVVEKVLHHTNKDKVIIIAHSMGGLVAREYIRNEGGINKVNKLITIGTPHHGIFGFGSLGCSFKGVLTSTSPECTDMKEDSNFLKNLNDGDETPGIIEYYSFIGKGCKILDNNLNDVDSDGVISVSSAKLEDANNVDNIIVERACPSPKKDLHGDIARKDNEIYNKILNILK